MQNVHSLVLAIPSYSIPDASAVYCSTPSSLLCPLCLSVLEQPVQLPCGALVCATCLCKWLGVSRGRSYPYCYQHDLDEHNITLLSLVVNDLLRDQRLRCQECGYTTTAGQVFRAQREPVPRAFRAHLAIPPQREGHSGPADYSTVASS